MYKNQSQNGKKRIQISHIFIEIYKAYPASIMGREDIELSNNIILPSSSLSKLSVMPNFGDSKNPILFRILNIELNISTHCGVVDFTAGEGSCYLPTNMFERLCLSEGQTINLRNVTLNQGNFIKIQPHKTEFTKNPNPKAILEYNLRNYFCVTEGDTISVKFGKTIYQIDIIQCKPYKAIKTLNGDIEVDFAPPKDYKEEEEQKIMNNKSYNIKFNSNDVTLKRMSEEEIKKQIVDKKFSGHFVRMDGKNVSNTQVEKIMKAKLDKKNNEEDYNPRNCRIIINPRLPFRFVEL